MLYETVEGFKGAEDTWLGGLMAKGFIKVDRDRCKGCHLCIEVCPRSVIEVSNELNKTGYAPAEFIENPEDGKGCNACTMCAVVCPDLAIEVYRAN
jgi:2-oxoglutarate ferredoxin oxidoreductase subunit delta